MGTKLGLFGQTRSALLALLYGHHDDWFYQRQLIKTLGSGHGAVQRELKQLAGLGLIISRLQGNQVLYRANPESPIYVEIKSLITKTAGLSNALRPGPRRLKSQSKVAIAKGSSARQDEESIRDVDRMVL